MKVRDIIHAQTHYELLNKLLHKNLKGYMQCRYDLCNGYQIWMIKLDGKQSKEGWTNNISNFGNTVTEIYTGNQQSRSISHREFPRERRLIFGIYGDAYSRYYMFHGVFELDRSSTNNHRIWNKIADEYLFEMKNNKYDDTDTYEHERKPQHDIYIQYYTQYYITFRHCDCDTKYYLKSLDNKNIASLTSDKREAKVFGDTEATKLCESLRKIYTRYHIGKMPK